MKRILLPMLCLVIFFSTGTAQFKPAVSSTDSLIAAAIEAVSSDSLRNDVQSLQNFGTRFMMAPNRREIAQWIMNRFIAAGVTEVRLDSFLCYTSVNDPPYCTYDTTTWQYNVEAKVPGSVFPDREIIMMGHYDSFNSYSDPMAAAPGADDNASSVAALLECARVIMLMGYQPEQTMIFLATAAEELNLVGDSGSGHYAGEAAASGRDLAMVINNDMIGWNSGAWSVSLIKDDNSPRITDLSVHVVDHFTTLDRNFSWFGTFCDLKYFLYEGYQGIYFMEDVENGFNPYYHSVDDLVDHIDTAYLAEMTGLNLGCFLFSDMLKNDAALLNVENVPVENCTGRLSPRVTMANYGSDTLFSLDIVCRVNEDDSVVFPWTGDLAFRETQLVELPTFEFTVLPENELVITLENINGTEDQVTLNNAHSAEFAMAHATPEEVKLKIMLDSHPEETSWDVKDAEGEIIYSGGPYSTPGSLVDVTMYFDDPGCYVASFYDAGGDGLQPGFFILYHGANNVIASVTSFESLAQVQFDVGGTMQLPDIDGQPALRIFPNPASEQVTLSFQLEKASPVSLRVYDVPGNLVATIAGHVTLQGRNEINFSCSGLPGGLYLVRLTTDDFRLTTSSKLIIRR